MKKKPGNARLEKNKISTKELLNRLKNSRDSTKRINIAENVYEILCAKDLWRKLSFLSQDKYFVEDLLVNWSEDAICLIKRFIKMWWGWLQVVLQEIAAVNPYMALHIFSNIKFRKLIYSCNLASSVNIKNISRMAKRRIWNIITRTEKYERNFYKYWN